MINATGGAFEVCPIISIHKLYRSVAVWMHLYFGTEDVGTRTNCGKAFENASLKLFHEDEFYRCLSKPDRMVNV